MISLKERVAMELMYRGPILLKDEFHKGLLQRHKIPVQDILIKPYSVNGINEPKILDRIFGEPRIATGVYLVHTDTPVVLVDIQEIYPNFFRKYDSTNPKRSVEIITMYGHRKSIERVRKLLIQSLRDDAPESLDYIVGDEVNYPRL